MINLNGTLYSQETANLSIKNRGLLYGDAVFETIKGVNGQLFFWEDHYFRLMASMRILRMDIPMHFSMEFLEDEIKKTIRAADFDKQSLRIKLYVNRKAGGKYNPTNHEVDYFIELETTGDPFYTFNEDRYEVELFKDHYMYANLLATLKSNAKIINVLGSIYATENGYQNCLLLNDKKMVIEALQGNLFLVKGTTIITPPTSDGCLRGIIRKQLIEICKTLQEYKLEEKSISSFDLQKADELFITNVMIGIQPISNYRKKIYKNEVARMLLQKLNVKVRLAS
ncbi:aminotransferase class IV [Flavobacteriaceae bacterium]|nr:aminotransferase class IV [Flavobacteriaceae bacterium]